MGHPIDKYIIELIKRAQGKDEHAIKELIRHTEKRIYNFCLNLSKNQPDAEDIAQESYIKILNQITKLSSPEKFWPWCFQIIRNTQIDIIRKKSKVPQSDEQSFDNEIDESRSSVSLEDNLMIRNALSQLEPEERYVLILVDLEDLSYSEAADIIKISEDNLRSRLHRARNKFLEKYSSHETKSKTPTSS